MWADDLASLIAKPTDAAGLRGRDAKLLAASLLHTALNPDRAGQSANFEPPIEIIELKGPLQLYRIYDGPYSVACGNWWVETEPLRRIVAVASRQRGFDAYDRHAFVLKLLRSAVCVHPGWTNYSDIARLDLAVGRELPAIRGQARERSVCHPLPWRVRWVSCSCLGRFNTLSQAISLSRSWFRECSGTRRTGHSIKSQPSDALSRWGGSRECAQEN
jgi:hypothetical protein